MLLVGLNDLLKTDDPENLKRDLRVSNGECVHVSQILLSLSPVLLPIDRPVARQPVHNVSSHSIG